MWAGERRADKESPSSFQVLDLKNVDKGKLLLISIFEKCAIKIKNVYRKIPNVSPGLIEVRKHFLGGLYSAVLYSG